MNKRFFLAIFVISLLFVTSLHAQNTRSVQVNCGAIFPIGAYTGFSGSFQINYPLSENLCVYLYSGYSYWDRDKVSFIAELNGAQKQQIFDSYSSDSHNQIPVYLGGKYDFYKGKFFTSFFTMEAGFSHLSYNNYANEKVVDPSNGVVLAYNVDPSSKTKVTENLFGLGIGTGISHQLTENINLILAYKINSYLNSRYYDFFSASGTYSMLLAGINVGI